MTFESNGFSPNPSTNTLDSRTLGSGLAGGTALVDPVSANSIKMSSSRNVGTIDSFSTITSKANLLKSGTALQDSISATSPDYFVIKLSEASDIKLSLGGLSANADLQMFDSTGKIVGTSAQKGNTTETLGQQLAAGNYYVAVYSAEGGSTAYSLNLSSTPSDFAGSTAQTARSIAVGSTTRDWVGTTDTTDVYKFSLQATTNLDVSFDGLNGVANAQLIDSKNTVVGTVTTAGRITRDALAAGDYTIRVNNVNNQSAFYNMRLGVKDLVKNDMTTTTTLTPTSSGVQAQEWVGGADQSDFYKFELKQSSTVKLDLTGLGANANLEIRDTTGAVVASSKNAGTTAESITQTLKAGNYYAVVLGDTTTATAYNLKLASTAMVTPTPSPLPVTPVAPTVAPSAVVNPVVIPTTITPVAPAPAPTAPTPSIAPAATDWASLNLKDTGLQQLARTRFADGKIDRQDMIAILSEAGDGGLVDATELTDLRTMVAAAGTLRLDDAVRVLANKVVNGDVANQWYTGGAKTSANLGNLFAGASSGHMDQLINKWFMGGDRPQLDGSVYTYTQGSLFVNGASAADVVQGSIGNCYFLSTLAGMANSKPDTVKDMFTDNGDGTFTVRFFKAGQTDYVTVDRFLATNSTGSLSFAKVGGNASNASNELWVALAEKAYAQLNESGWIGQDGKNSFKGIEGGWMSGPINQLTNLQTNSNYATKDANQSWSMKQQDLINMVNNKQIVTAGFISGGSATLSGFQKQYGIVDNHAYTITGYNATTGQFTVNNPWGTKHANLTWSQLQDLETDFVYSTN